MDRSSLLFWWPRIQDLHIPMPLTVVVPTPDAWIGFVDALDGDYTTMELYKARFESAAEKIGYPLFMRTDKTSAKFDWENTCYVQEQSVLMRHIYRLIEFSIDIPGTPISAFVFRKYIPMASIFSAFWGNMPVNPERRYFVNDGQVLCHHSYWVEDAIAEWHGALPLDWRKQLAKANTEGEEIPLLSTYSRKVARELDGYWSVDYCQDADGQWWLIDMADGHLSWHPECPHRVGEDRALI